MQATLTFLGTGTSMGVPTLGCGCAVCASAVDGTQPRNRRTRTSARIEFNSRTVLIDTGQDFHVQAVREKITQVDAVLYTHGHADHILGMDDLRPLSFANPIPLYADEETAATIERIFEYTFRKQDRYTTSARVEMHRVSTAPGTQVELFGAAFQRIPVQHGRQTITGWRFGKAAYLTDLSSLPEESFPLLEDLDILILDALRRAPHPSHSNLENSIALAKRIQPRQAFFTHISHDLDHDTINAELPPNIRMAYDGLQVPFQIAEDTE
ncbi:MBL fold metallo-hydrolase [Terriglobus tenax]|uniref:MBL fold metallo-hydrolase n=1 Tax=Terriglobus tenax TaxID=1111115 RepID=UPI0021DF6A1F|nr:MBL fold metallo-hydrolase [Terriglobus tenax]